MFGKKRNKKEDLMKYCENQGIVSSAEIRKWGNANYYISCDRVVRKVVEEARIKGVEFPRKLSMEECALKNLNGKMAYYQFS
jgi:hypothetical protein